MKLIKETSLADFEAWSGAVETLERICEEGKDEQLEFMLEELYPEGLTETQLNDLLWFESEWLYEALDIENEESEENE